MRDTGMAHSWFESDAKASMRHKHKNAQRVRHMGGARSSRRACFAELTKNQHIPRFHSDECPMRREARYSKECDSTRTMQTGRRCPMTKPMNTSNTVSLTQNRLAILSCNLRVTQCPMGGGVASVAGQGHQGRGLWPSSSETTSSLSMRDPVLTGEYGSNSIEYRVRGDISSIELFISSMRFVTLVRPGRSFFPDPARLAAVRGAVSLNVTL